MRARSRVEILKKTHSSWDKENWKRDWEFNFVLGSIIMRLLKECQMDVMSLLRTGGGIRKREKFAELFRQQRWDMKAIFNIKVRDGERIGRANNKKKIIINDKLVGRGFEVFGPLMLELYCHRNKTKDLMMWLGAETRKFAFMTRSVIDKGIAAS